MLTGGKRKTIQGAPGPYTTAFSYDLSGKPTGITYPDTYQVSYVYYPGANLLHTVTGSDSQAFAVCTLYEPSGKMGRIDHGNGTSTIHTYDPLSTRLTQITTRDPSMLPENDIQRRAYTYYGSGDIESVTDSLDGVTYNYTYDNLHRLTGETNTGGFDALGYAYDATGNITSKTKGQDIYTYSYKPAHPHAVSKIDLNGTDYDPPYTYDFNGNLVSGPDFTDPQQIAARTIGYNTDNMPSHISHAKGGNTVYTDFLYDGLGQRAKKSVINSITTIHTYYIDEYFELEDSAPVKYVFAGNLRVARATPSGTVYFHKDHLGSSSAMSDATGAVIETSNYMPFGGMRVHSGISNSDYKFTDQELDNETGLYNYDARLYDPVIGRFISADNIVPDPFDPQSLNRYSYCRNNPLIYTDPTGNYRDFGGGGGDDVEGGMDANTDERESSDTVSLPDITVTATRDTPAGFNGNEQDSTSIVGKVLSDVLYVTEKAATDMHGLYTDGDNYAKTALNIAAFTITVPTAIVASYFYSTALSVSYGIPNVTTNFVASIFPGTSPAPNIAGAVGVYAGKKLGTDKW